MINLNCEQIEEELDLVIPDIYRFFIDAVNSAGFDLKKYRIYHDTETILTGNQKMRENLSDSIPPWQNHYFDFGVGDGCGNYFFLHANDEKVDQVQLWSHDPAGIEDVSTGTSFFQRLLKELEIDFQGPDRYSFDGNRYWD